MSRITLYHLQELPLGQSVIGVSLVSHSQTKEVVVTGRIDVQRLLKGTNRFFSLIQLSISHPCVEKDEVLFKPKPELVLEEEDTLIMIGEIAEVEKVRHVAHSPAG